jgi:general transcriptional corepressor CYC8
MQDDLQKAYSAYQHALYSLPNPKVFAMLTSAAGKDYSSHQTGKSEVMVRDWNSLRPVRVFGQRRGGFLVRPKDGQRYVHVCSITIHVLLRELKPDFDKSNEVLFRLGIIYKQQTKYEESLRCFDRILRNPPSPLANADIWFQIGHVYEQQGDVSVD